MAVKRLTENRWWIGSTEINWERLTESERVISWRVLGKLGTGFGQINWYSKGWTGGWSRIVEIDQGVENELW